MAAYGDVGSLGPSHMAGTGTMDSIVQIWWLAWAAHALPQVHDLFLAQGQNSPLGQNFGVNGSMLALGVLFVPVTKIFGPVVTYNVLLRLALAASAAAMCFVLRRWTSWWPAAFVGGLLYGFSAYTSNFGEYVFLIFVPLPPLILLLLNEIFIRQHWPPRRTGIILGLLCALQFFIWVEVLAGTLIMGTVAVAVVLVVSRGRLVVRWRYAATALAYSLGVVGVLLAYPVIFTFAGPEHINGPPAAPIALATLNGDLVSPLIPSWRQWLDPSAVGQLGPAGSQAGNLLYLGLPLVVVLACFAAFLRSRREILFAGAMAIIAFVLFLGSSLHIDGHHTSVPLPFALFVHIPALSGFEARRFALYADLFAAAMFAIGIDELWKRAHERPELWRLSRGWSKALGVVALAALMLLVCLPLVPSATQTSSPANVPAFFASNAVDAIPSGSVVLAYPYPDQTSTDDSAYLQSTIGQSLHSVMLDQSVAGMRYKLIGGYGWFPSPSGHGGTTSPALLEPQSVQTLFDVALIGVERQTLAQRAILAKSTLANELRVFLRKFNVQTVIVSDQLVVSHPGHAPIHLGDSSLIISRVTAAIGPPVEIEGLSVWFHVNKRLSPRS